MRDCVITLGFTLIVSLGCLLFRNSIDIYMIFLLTSIYLFEQLKGEK